jgi:hypothetical protein
MRSTDYTSESTRTGLDIEKKKLLKKRNLKGCLISEIALLNQAPYYFWEKGGKRAYAMTGKRSASTVGGRSKAALQEAV